MITTNDAETIALRALTYVAQEEKVLQSLIAQSGMSSSSLQERLHDPDFLGGILDFLLSNEKLLVDFCEIEKLSPDKLARVRQALPGAPTDW